MKLYVVDCGPLSPRCSDHAYALISEAGELLAEHICSDIGWAMGDLEGRRPERQARWRERFGDYEVLHIGEDTMTEAELQRRHEEWADDPPLPECPSIATDGAHAWQADVDTPPGVVGCAVCPATTAWPLPKERRS